MEALNRKDDQFQVRVTENNTAMINLNLPEYLQ